VYHELIHTTGGIRRAPLPYGNLRDGSLILEESMTDLLAMRASGRTSIAYNQKAIKLLDTFEGIIDPSKTTLATTYGNRNFSALFDQITEYTGDPSVSEAIIQQLAETMEGTMSSNMATRAVAEQDLQGIIDFLVANQK